MRLLLVEDDEMLGASLKKALENHAYGVDWVKDGEEALRAVDNPGLGAIVLDINLPKVSGLQVVRALRQNRNDTPVLLLTARDSPAQKVEGLDGGADDYLVKPFNLDELLARLRSLIRRSKGRADFVLHCQGVDLDAAAKTVHKDGARVVMTAKELQILQLLMERAGKYVSKQEIEQALYATGAPAESNAVEVTIYNLRRKLGADFIQTIRGVGYLVNP